MQATATPLDIRLMNATAAVLSAAAVLAFVWMAVTWVTRWPVFAIRAVRIEGDVTRNSASTIRANAVPKLAGNFFTIDLERAQRAFESVPWVRRARVQRVWPDRLAVHLEEHRPAAYWGEDRLVNTFGEVFDANLGDVEDEDLPTLRGPEGSAAQVLALYRRLTPVIARLDTRIDTLVLSARGSWRAELDDGGRIEIGRGEPDEVLARVERFVATWYQVSARYPGPLQYADLRHHNGYAVRIKGVTTTVPESRRIN
ncbi:cell division protein FtsQ/DivIB [Caldimonas thermodepolymerans]|jgi:cell division protein FtsQ|uniref:Cell division protein FtsQ n=1 Tax=Caldimonas thermodepolymerans TaxID=215580 RepID=A0A2S5T0Y4_9BURK|nr:cell division protein FtsQ/DivIB [Caldimonas thermodepolymerans]PPE68548.1 cell division protein FtsQ [Caldimonas thermodepolymerans]QPC30869.1 cell division protein FtsQ/DivIB [Caldimonas thermodepolymerans]RDH97131.1 cell division protein FtsQ [Caldimonas thermodepolymerans]TCP08967.1 cell division protein FtsQ [Caldimonas thermodepolymerans]UZG43606.1 cell division protein FtsQ/DivIB [Caldimonas thermodepolymerans]